MTLCPLRLSALPAAIEGRLLTVERKWCILTPLFVTAQEPSGFATKGGDFMDTVRISEYAGALYRARGGKAEAEASEKFRQCEQQGKLDEARDWNAIRRAIRAMRGPNES